MSPARCYPVVNDLGTHCPNPPYGISRAYLEDVAKMKDMALIQKPFCYSTRLQLETRSTESDVVFVFKPRTHVVAPEW